MADFHIYADEAWTHSGPPMGRYWCFFGGIFGSEEDLNKLNQQYCLVRKKYNFYKEIKWSSLNEKNEHIYMEFIEKFLIFLIQDNSVIYRQFFTDRAFIHKDAYDKGIDKYSIDVQFKLYYQFLKHLFPLDKLPNNSSIKVSLDNHTAQKNKEALESFLMNYWTSNNAQINYVSSSKKNHIQAIDLIVGMSGYRGNGIFLKPYGSKKKKKLKKKFSQYVYDQMRGIDAHWRGSKVFNLFSTTSISQYKDAPLSQKIKIWKFVPHDYYKDKGWENDHLSSKKEYQGENIYYKCPETQEWKKKNDK